MYREAHTQSAIVYTFMRGYSSQMQIFWFALEDGSTSGIESIRFIISERGRSVWKEKGNLQANINLNFLYFLMATATTSAVPPLASSVMWARCSKIAALSGTDVENCWASIWPEALLTIQLRKADLQEAFLSRAVSVTLGICRLQFMPTTQQWKSEISITSL